MMNALLRIIALSCIALSTSCARNISPDTYAAGSVGQVNRAVRGTIISARPVHVSGNNSGLGAGTGAIGGGISGSAIGGNVRANALGALGGAVAGGIAGAVIEEQATKQEGIEYVVQSENGALLTVVQGFPAFKVSQKVIVLYGSQSRIIPDSTP